MLSSPAGERCIRKNKHYSRRSRFKINRWIVFMMNNIHHMNIYSSCKLCLYFYIKTSKTLSCMDILPIVPCIIQNKNIEQPDSILSNPAVFIALTHLFYLASVLIFNDLDHGAIRYFVPASV